MVAFCIASIVLLSVIHFSEANVFTSQQENDVIKFVNHVMKCRHIPGLTLSVVDGSRTWTKGFGIADVISKRPVDEETLFGIGSLGKAFTATLLGSMLDKTSYDWYTKLDDIEEVYYEFATEELTRNATLADLLAHRTGLSKATDNGFIAGYPRQVTRDFLSGRLKFIPKVGNFRETFLYNNCMYMILGDVIEKLGKDSYDSLMLSWILEPIGMMSTYVSTSSDDVIRGNVAKPIIAKEEGGEFEEGNYEIYNMVPLEPAGVIMSNAVDMAKWMRFNLNNGTTESGKPLISGELFSRIFQPESPLYYFALAFDLRNSTFPINDLQTAYGLGWFISTYRGHKRFWHSGGLFSYVSYQWLFPDEKIGIFANVNGPGHNHNPSEALRVILYYISDILLGEEPWLSSDTGCTFPSPWMNATSFTPPQPNPPLTPNLTEYTGCYGNPIFPDIEIKLSNDSLILHMNRVKGKLHPTDTADLFKLELTDPWEYAIENVVNENFTMMVLLKFARDGNETVSFSWFMDTLVTFEKGVYLLNETDYSPCKAPESPRTISGGSTIESSRRFTMATIILSCFVFILTFHI